MKVGVLSDLTKHRFGDEIPCENKITITGARGERVAFQIIVLESCHNVKVEGDNQLKSEAFYEKYIPVKQATTALSEKGLYPDILVDEKRACIHGDNSSESGELLLFCFVDVPCEKGKNTYNLTFKVTADEGESLVYVKIDVMDFCLPEENHNATAFLTMSEMINGSKEEIDEKYDELIEEGLKYRISPVRIIPWGEYSFDYIIDKMKKLALDKRCNQYSIPYKTKHEDTIQCKNEEVLDIENLKELFLKMAENSTDKVNLFKKANMYVGFIDEPEPDNFYRVKRVYEEIYNLKREIIKEYDFKNKRIVELSLLTFDNIVTVFNKEPLYGEVDTWCPTFWAYQKPEYIYEEKKLRGLGKKNWWYGCMAPYTPFPNLHTDSKMRDHRFESWLRYKYDVKGNLYWATNLTKRYDTEKKQYFPCNTFDDAMLYSGTNGDGLLFYTETSYGKPLPSLRLISMFSGLQEYEYFWMLDNNAKNAEKYYFKCFDTRAMLKPVFDRLSYGMMFVYDFDINMMKKEVGKRVELSKYNIFIEGFVKSDSCVVNVFAPLKYEITLNNQNGKEFPSGMGKYVQFILNGNENVIANLIFSESGKTIIEKNIIIAEKRVPLALNSTITKSHKIAVECLKNETYVSCSSFVNEEKPCFYIPVKGSTKNIRSTEISVRGLSGDAFVMNVILVDKKGNKYWSGYDVVNEKCITNIHIGVTPLTENHLNKVEDVEVAKYYDKNIEKSSKFDFENIVGIEIILENNIKLLDENRERKISSYSFVIEDGYLSII